MALLFHQNMRVYGGGAAGRNAVYANRFAAINAILPAGIIAAGFTEISNPNAGLRAQLLALSGTLDGGLTNLVVVQVGTSALGWVEYIGITWDPVFLTVQHAGQVAYNNLTRRWTTYAVAAAAFPVPPVLTIPAVGLLAADSRGPAYVAGVFGGNPTIIMYMHNMYLLGNRSAGYSGLQNSAASIRNQIGGAYAAARVFVGGDYNVDPRDLRKRRSNLPILTFRAALDLNGNPVNTTAANPYDFWLLSNTAGIPAANAMIYAQTRVAQASDHSAITLRIA